MHRRGYATQVGALAAVTLAGCLRADGGGGPVVEGSDVTLAPGERASVTVRAETVDRLRFGVSFLDSDAVAVESFDVTPPPDAVAESFPPVWSWDDPQSSVQATMALRASEDAPAVRVSYSVTAALGDDEVTEAFDVEVRA
jgi:hypothetical protein